MRSAERLDEGRGAAPKRGVLLVNLGTPEAPTEAAVRAFLEEFLSDPAVVDLAAPMRWLLLHALVLPLRSRRSARAYARVWTDEGSPLLVQTRAQAAALAARLPDLEVRFAMRYGRPSLDATLAELRARGVTELVVAPMFPQHASATTGSARARIEALARGLALRFVPPFFAHPGFIEAQAERVREAVRAIDAEHVLFSYHGIPARQLRPACPAPCGDERCCGVIEDRTADCYRAQCYATSRALAHAVGGASSSTAFQSRLRGTRWIGPYTDDALVELAARGVKRVAVACPGFVAACLETLEEIALRGEARFRASGGERLILVPALDASPTFIDMLVAEIRRAAP